MLLRLKAWCAQNIENQALLSINVSTYNTKLSYLRKIICLRKSDIFVEKISVPNINENLAEYGKQCLPSIDANDVINLIPTQLRVYTDVRVVIETPF